MSYRFTFIAGLAFLIAATLPGEAHPHVWVTMTEELVYAPDGSVTGVRHAWTFDDMFSAYATQGLEQKTKGQFTREELDPLAKVNVESLKEYAYFTYAKVPFKTPMKTKALDVEIYDPEFFIDFGFAEKDPARLVGAPALCAVAVEKPRDDFFSASVRLDKSMAWEANAGTGAKFANRISVTCP
jgi:ABC-type uncharacterized transport system substrate-binding protein